MYVELLASDNDELLLRLKWVESLERPSLTSTKSGRSVMRQAQRMANAGSTCDLERYTNQSPHAQHSGKSGKGFRSENVSGDTESH